MEPRAEVDRLARQCIGSAIEVHRQLGPGYLERIYEEALAIELTARGISCERQVEFAVDYKGIPVGASRLDMLIEKRLVLELKAVEQLHAVHKAQVISYLKATRLQLALLINFNVPVLKNGIQRIILT